jgi:hypothetical protein
VVILRLPGTAGQGIVTGEFVTLVRSCEPSNLHRLRHVAVHLWWRFRLKKMSLHLLSDRSSGVFRKCLDLTKLRRKLGGADLGELGREVRRLLWSSGCDRGDPYVLNV